MLADGTQSQAKHPVVLRDAGPTGQTIQQLESGQQSRSRCGRTMAQIAAVLGPQLAREVEHMHRLTPFAHEGLRSSAGGTRAPARLAMVMRIEAEQSVRGFGRIWHFHQPLGIGLPVKPTTDQQREVKACRRHRVSPTRNR